MLCHCPICDEVDEVYCVCFDRSYRPDDLAEVCIGVDCPWLTTLCGWKDRPMLQESAEARKEP
jgi:hypothetical protein